LDLDIVALSRAQFALTVMIHYLFPPLSIGLGALMVLHEGMFLGTGDRHWEALTRFYTKLFAVNFAIGVATGIVMEFEFGTNWAAYSRFVGDVFGSALAAEGIFAFFLESGFLAVLVFGWDRVSPKMHFFSTLMVFARLDLLLGLDRHRQLLAADPGGLPHRDEGGNGPRAEIVDFWAMVFNPSTMTA
jgi:cytochrome d ubiquinol oxidase subunit I